MITKFANIILPLPLAHTYTYSIPTEMEQQIAVGMRVIVHFGANKFYTGIVVNIHSNHPNYAKIKPIAALIDEKPILLPTQLQLWNFVSQYYQAALSDIYKTVLPSGLKIENESIIELVPEMIDTNLSKSEEKIINILKDEKPHPITEFTTSQLKHIKHLIDIGIIAKTEKTTDNYKPKFTDFIAINPTYINNTNEALNIIGRAKKQKDLLEKYIELSGGYNAISKKELLDTTGISPAILKQLTDKNILHIEKRRTYRIDTTSTISADIHQLTQAQQTAYEAIKSAFSTHQTTLLHGITSSGKTEIYIQLIKDYIAQGKQVLMLVPETGLTQQLANRMKQYFGGEMGIFHSFCSSYERVETYQHQLSDNPYKLILGVRSSIFLPYHNLGLIIIDEEHDMGYKQTEPAPRYHARDVATLLARIHGAKTLLGTATPSIETYANCYSGKYKLVELNQRYGGIALPQIQLIDIKECYRKKQIKGHFSLQMIDTIKHCIEAGEQVILFQNRRGFAPYMKCTQCGYVPKCPNCDVSLTYHRHNDTLTCHYCGHTISIHNHPNSNHHHTLTMPSNNQTTTHPCPQCKEGTLSTHGFGTEQVEEETKQLFPNYQIARLDSDTTHNPKTFDTIVETFQQGKINILIGTQMIAKGLDFNNVGLVGILNADNILYHPDFRAYERAYQLLVQVSGRTGRHTKQGKVLIQTYQPENPIFNQILTNNYQAYFNQEMSERHTFHYPPYVRLIRIIIKHTDINTCIHAANTLANKLKLKLHNRILGPDTPSIARIQNKHIKQILIKIETTANPQQAKQIIHDEIQSITSQQPYKTLQIYLDIDPI